MDFEAAREQMIKNQLLSRGIKDKRVIEAMRRIPREEFVPSFLKARAYDDGALPIGWGQTISQPYIVALIAQLLTLKGREKVLDIGTGSGYQAAILSLLAKEVFSLERIPSLAKAAEKRLRSLGLENVRVIVADGNLGLPDEAPFEAIAVAAATSSLPSAWKEQLKEGGRLVFPRQKEKGQWLIRGVKKGGDLIEKEIIPVVFVPLVRGEDEKKRSFF